MNREDLKKKLSLLLVDHNPKEILKHCTDDVKIILHPRHVAAGIYDKKSIFNLFEHLAKSFPNWSETIEKVYHDSEERVFITIAKGNSSTIKGIWDIHILYYDKNNKIFKIEERIDTLHLAEGNVGPRI